MNRKFITGVPLHNGVPRLERLTNPDGGILAEACERREGQVAGIVAYYNTLKSKVELPYRKNVIPAQQVELGERMRADAEKAEARESQARAHVTKSRKLATELDVPENWANNPQKLRLAERVRAARAQAEQETSKENQ